MAATAAINLLANSLQVDVIAHLRLVTHHVQPRLGRIAVQVFVLEVRLILEEQVMHRPEFSLRRGRLGRFRGQQRVG